MPVFYAALFLKLAPRTKKISFFEEIRTLRCGLACWTAFHSVLASNGLFAVADRKTGVHRQESHLLSRRKFLGKLRWAPALFLPARFYGAHEFVLANRREDSLPSPEFSDVRVAPNYPTKSPLDAVLRKVAAGTDEFLSERHAFEIMARLREWSSALRRARPELDVLSRFLHPSIEASSLRPLEDVVVRKANQLEVRRRRFASNPVPGRERFAEELKSYLGDLQQIETADFQIVAMNEVADTPLTVQAEIRYDLVGTRLANAREQRVGIWLTWWVRTDNGEWNAIRWQAEKETVSRASGPIFIDVTAHALDAIPSYAQQLRFGVDHWRTVLDGACGIDVFGNNGAAVGDFDGDGFDDLYVCQPPGLPNRLYRNRGDGTFEDATEHAGVGVLDGTACALFADFENKGRPDLLVICGSGPLLFQNQGNGRFALKGDAFQFDKPPQGAFTHAAVADYDGDGLLDIYFCVYSYYLGLDQYRYPVPYFDARNGPPNFLFHNEGNGSFRDRTAAAGLHSENDRYSFACAWGDYTGNGTQDLFVANDFGRSNLYRNNGDGTFSAVSGDARVDDPGAGMSAAALDFDGDGKLDIYSANMWSAAGLRVSQQKNFQADQPEEIRSLYRRHAAGNSLYRNQGGGKFQNVAVQAGVAMGRWAWASDSWDFDHDGLADLYITNGYISAASPQQPDADDLASFFWRQVVAKSPATDNPSPNYEQGWNAINELIRSDYSWNGFERNVLYLNNGDGTFTDISGVAGMDFPEDSRAFALADIDGDGRLEVILKNRNAPQLRILHNAMEGVGHSIAFRLRGVKSNRDAIGAAITVQAGSLRQRKFVQAGSGFLSQHTKDVFFGVGQSQGPVRATIQWPSGASQVFDALPVGHRVEIAEDSNTPRNKPFVVARQFDATAPPPRTSPAPEGAIETWLFEPLTAPEFSLPNAAGQTMALRSLRGAPLLLAFWSTGSPESVEQLQSLVKRSRSPSGSGLRVLGIHADEPGDLANAKSLVAQAAPSFEILFATPEVAGIYNIVYRYLFDRRRDLRLPTSFLLDPSGQIVKLYQGFWNPERFLEDAQTIPQTPAERSRKALPFAGLLCQGRFQRNEFTYGVAFFQHGYFEQAAASFQQVIAKNPENAEAQYNLGTLYLRSNRLPNARPYLEQAVKLRPNYAEAWNNLGMLAAQQGQDEEAIHNFRQALTLRPNYEVALLNLANLYRRQRDFRQAEPLLTRALSSSPDDPDVNYNLGMLYAREEQFEKATPFLEKAIRLRPDYPDALNNLGVLLVQSGRTADAEEKFQACIRVAPEFDQAYLNLAHLYVVINEKEKARDVLQTLLRVRPGHAMAQKALEMLN